MSSMKPCTSKFDSVDSILNYLREPSPSEVVSSSTTSSIIGSTIINNRLKSTTKKGKKEKELINVMNSKETVQILSSGRVRYGPITVNPRKQPSKTLFTGRRSKYEVLSGDEEEKRRIRRERNRVAATKCREKRDNVLFNLDNEYDTEVNKYTELRNLVQQLEQQKQYLQSLVSNHILTCPLQQVNYTPPMVFGNTGFLSSIMETPAPALPPHQLEIIKNDEEKFGHHFLQPAPILTNSAYNTDQSNHLFNSQQQTITMNSSSLDRLINSLQSPTPYIDNNNNNTCSGLYNSAYGTSSCAQQHSNSGEDDSLPPTHDNPYVC